MNIIRENDKYYLINGNEKTLLSNNVLDAFLNCYDGKIPENKIPYLCTCNEISKLDGVNTTFVVTNNAVRVISRDKNGNILDGNEIVAKLEEGKVENRYNMKIVKEEGWFKRHKTKAYKAASKLLLVAAIAAGAAGAYYLASPLVEDASDTASEIQNTMEIKDYIATQTVDISEDTTYEGTTYSTSPYTYENNVVAYLDAPGLFDTVYPVAQADDDEYYLKHDIYGNESSYGTAAKAAANGEGLSDDVTIIYAHNMGNTSMFSNLAKYADKTTTDGTVYDGQTLYDQVQDIDYYDEYGHYVLHIVSAGVYTGSEEIDKMFNLAGDFDSEEEKLEFIEWTNAHSDIETGYTINMEAPMVILQTCPDKNAKDYEGSRVFVICEAEKVKTYKDLPNDYSLGNSL